MHIGRLVQAGQASQEDGHQVVARRRRGWHAVQRGDQASQLRVGHGGQELFVARWWRRVEVVLDAERHNHLIDQRVAQALDLHPVARLHHPIV